MQISILSGKGGSGKTSLTAALITLMAKEHPLILVDADVDASNLDLIIPSDKQNEYDFLAGKVAQIDPDNCIACGICENVCRFGAVEYDAQAEQPYHIDPMHCEGCAVCAHECPQEAIALISRQDGVWFHSTSPYGNFFHAHLYAGHENSGKLVATILTAAHEHAENDDKRLIIVDGPPGIGCPVIATCTQTDAAIIVTEPTPSGIHDMLRILDTTQHFKKPSYVIINKADLHPENAHQIEDVCQQRQVPVLGSIPFDPQFNKAMVQAQPITTYAPESLSSQSIVKIWHNLQQELNDFYA